MVNGLYCIKVETIKSYELFEDIKKAFKCCETLQKAKEKYKISLVIAKNTYWDEGVLNYEDLFDTIQKELKGGLK